MGNININRVINYFEERIKQQNEKIFQLEKNIEIVTSELKKLQHKINNQDSLHLKEIIINDKIIFIGKEYNRELYLNENNKLVQNPPTLWF